MKRRTFRVALVLSDADVADITSATSPRVIRREVAAFVRACVDASALRVLAARRAPDGEGGDSDKELDD